MCWNEIGAISEIKDRWRGSIGKGYWMVVKIILKLVIINGREFFKKTLITVHGACIVFIVSISEAAGQWLREQAEELLLPHQVRAAGEQVQTIMVPDDSLHEFIEDSEDRDLGYVVPHFNEAKIPQLKHKS